jgi:hypothetical protein
MLVGKENGLATLENNLLLSHKTIFLPYAPTITLLGSDFNLLSKRS